MNTRQWLEKLVAFDTTSRNSNLFATLPATQGPEAGNTQGGIVLSGHTDVVPVDGQNWDSDPFKLTERDGLLYGRGSCDMKGYIAASLALVPEFLAMPRTKPLH